MKPASRAWWIADESVRALGVRAGDLLRVDVRQGSRRVRVSYPARRSLPFAAFCRRVALFTPVSETEARYHATGGAA